MVKLQYRMQEHLKHGNMNYKIKNYLCNMEADNKYYETGSDPYFLNRNNTAKDYSFNIFTNPENGILNTLLNKVTLVNNVMIMEPIDIVDEYITLE